MKKFKKSFIVDLISFFVFVFFFKFVGIFFFFQICWNSMSPFKKKFVWCKFESFFSLNPVVPSQSYSRYLDVLSLTDFMLSFRPEIKSS